MPDKPAQGKPAPRHFTRKHYLALQDTIRAHICAAPIEDQDKLLALTKALCMMLRAEYPQFDEDRFLRLCGLTD